MERKKKIVVIFGGQSSEHEVARVSATAIINNIDKRNYDLAIIGITKEGKWLNYNGPVEKIASGEWEQIALESSTNKLLNMTYETNVNNSIRLKCIDENLLTENAKSADETINVIFPVIHGCNGEDGTIQGLFELAGVPYVGAGVLASAMGMDKIYAKIVFEKAGIPQGNYIWFTRKDVQKDVANVVNQIEAKFTYPCFVKPSNSGSSVGISKAHDRDELIKALEIALKYDRKVLIEEFINAREIECAVLGNDEPIASTVGEIITNYEFYSYDAKYRDDDLKLIIPADIPQDTVSIIRDYAIKAFRTLDLAGLARVDFFVDKETGKAYINEVNTMPGFTSVSMYPKLWEATGIPFPELIGKLVDLAIERHEENKKHIDC